MNEIIDCSCGRPAYTQRIGRRLPKWWVACACGQRTENHVSYKRAIAAWNQGERRDTKNDKSEANN